MKEVIADIDRWQAAGRRVAIARVIGVEGSGHEMPRHDGRERGRRGRGLGVGGCVEGAVVAEALAVLESGTPKCARSAIPTTRPSQSADVRGTVHVLVEPLDW